MSSSRVYKDCFLLLFLHTVYTWLDMLTHMDAIYIYRFIYIICIYLCTEEALNYMQTSFIVFSAKLLRYIAGEKGTQDVHVRWKENKTNGDGEMTVESRKRRTTHTITMTGVGKKLGNWGAGGHGGHVASGVGSGYGLSLGSHKYARRRFTHPYKG